MKIRGVIGIALAAIVLMIVVKLHVIRDEGGGGYVLWKDDEAYLFMYDRPIGYRLNMLSYLLEPVKEYFRAPALATDGKLTISIIRISSAKAERHDQESTVGFDYITPIDGEIYAHCPGGICKLAAGQFQLISDQEEQKMGGDGRLSKGEFTEVNGWSKRGVKGAWVGDEAGRYEFSIDLSDRTRLVVRGGNPVSIDLLRPDHAQERVWYHEQRTRRVSSSEYHQVFQQEMERDSR